MIVKLCESEKIIYEMRTSGRKLNTQDLVSEFVYEQEGMNLDNTLLNVYPNRNEWMSDLIGIDNPVGDKDAYHEA